LLEEQVSTFNGQEIIMQEVLSDLLGAQLLAQMYTLILMPMYKKFTATKLEDADPIMLTTLMEETLVPLMEAQEHAKPLSKFHFT
jgi:saccharopine dehydrogenase-like NADP-dependent oxidoreductase